MSKANHTAAQFIAVARQIYGADIDHMDAGAAKHVAKHIGIDQPYFLTKPEHRVARGIYSLRSLESAQQVGTMPARREFVLGPDAISAAADALPAAPVFSIGERFEFAERLVTMVAMGTANAAVLVSSAGLGKTHLVRKVLAEHNLQECVTSTNEDNETITTSGDYVFFKGYSTAKAMYRALYDNNGRIIVFDDIDSVFKDKNAVNILKGALDTYDKRVISWNAELRDPNDDLPRRFEFTGRIIFISNQRMADLDEAVRSRAMVIDLSATTEEKLQWMETVLPNFMPEIDIEIKEEVLEFFKENAHLARAINMRTLRALINVRNSFSDNWERIAQYTLMNMTA